MSVSARRLSESVYCAERRLAAALADGSCSGCGRGGSSDGIGVAVTMTGVGGLFAAAAAVVATAAAELAGTKREVFAEDDGGGGGDGAVYDNAIGS